MAELIETPEMIEARKRQRAVDPENFNTGPAEQPPVQPPGQAPPTAEGSGEPFTIPLRTSPEFLADKGGRWQPMQGYKIVGNDDGTYSLMLTENLELAQQYDDETGAGAPGASGFTEAPRSVLCKRCDIYVGFQAAGLVDQPEEDDEWLEHHCWRCGRSREELMDEQGGDGIPRAR